MSIKKSSFVCGLLGAMLLVPAVFAQGDTISGALESAASTGQLEPDLVIVYDDLHGLHGGTAIEVSGDGEIRRRDVQRGQESSTQKTLTPTELQSLVRLLVEVEAWAQHNVHPPTVSDSSVAQLTIRWDDREVGFWEPYNEMQTLGRLERVRTHLDSLLPAQ